MTAAPPCKETNCAREMGEFYDIQNIPQSGLKSFARGVISYTFTLMLL